jgi:hypothetical protein
MESNVTLILLNSIHFSEFCVHDQSINQRFAFKISKFTVRTKVLYRLRYTFTAYWGYFVDSQFEYNFVFNLSPQF